MTIAGRPGLVVIGASLGGLAALPVLLRALPADYRAPVVIVQRRS
jgi:chemotaxis response regulator CheB